MALPTNVLYTENITVIHDTWLNGVNDWVNGWYGILGSTYTAAAARTAVSAAKSGANSDITSLRGIINSGTTSTGVSGIRIFTIAELLTGVISITTSGVTGFQLDTATNIVAGLSASVGTTIRCLVRLSGSSTNAAALTSSGSDGISVRAASATINFAVGSSWELIIRVTATGTPAVEVYGTGYNSLAGG